MDITISVNALRAVMARALGVTGTKTGSMPILSTVLLEAEQTPGGGVLIARAYDLELGVESRVPCECHKAGAVAVPAKLLADVAKALPEQVARLTAAANNRLEVTSGAASLKLAGLPATDFPTLPTAPAKAAWAPVDQHGLAAALARVAYAMSTDETRYNLNGVFVEFREDHLALVATDGHRLAVTQLPGMASYGLDGAGAIVGAKAVGELRALLSEESTEPGELAFAGGSLLYRRPGLTLVARLVDGSFPDWTQVVPTVDRSKALLTVGRAGLRDVLRRVLLMADDKGASVTLALSETRLTVTARNADSGEARDSVAVDYRGAAQEVAVNGRYLGELTSVESCESLVAQVADDLSPLVWWPADDETTRHVVMPMRR